MIAVLWLGAFLASWKLRPLGRAAVPPPVQANFSGVVGVNLDRSELTGNRLTAALEDLKMGGIRWVRFTLPWDQIEPARGQFEWAQWDAIFAALAKQPSLQPVVVLDGAPTWARAAADADNPHAPPHERADFGAFAAAVARRYGAQVRYYQVWHEPNIAPHWGAGPADPAGYLGLLREAAVQLRAADADAQIVLAALAPTTESGPANLSDLSYLSALYGLGARAWFDIAAAEPYGFSQPADAAAAPSVLNFGRATLLHQVMLAHGDGDTPLWATAFGWNTVTGSPWGSVGETDQARYTGQALGMARADWPWLGPIFWAALCPERPSGDPWLGFAVFDPAVCGPAGPQKSVWGALATNSAPATILSAGQHAADAPALRYSPGWRVTPSAADPSQDGDTLDFWFSGTGLALRIQGGPYWAYDRIAVDGEPANALPRDETGASYLVLHDPLGRPRWVTVARDLPAGQHSVHLEATGGWGQWALQGVRVTAAASRPVWAAWSLLGLALLATLLWLALAWPFRRSATGWLRSRLDAAAAWPEPLLWFAAAALALLLILTRNFALDLIALAGLGLLFIARPDLALPLIAAALPFWQHPEPLLGMGLAHYEIFLWVAVLALAVRMLVVRLADGSSGEPVAKADAQDAQESSTFNLDWPVLALFVSGLLSTLFAQEQGVAWREFRMVFLGGALFYWLITRTPWPQGRRFSATPLLGGFLAGMVAASLIALWQLASGQGRVDVEGVWRVRALYGSPNNLALVLDRAIPLALALAAFGTLTRRDGQMKLEPSAPICAHLRSVFGLAALWLALAVMLVACIATFSKGGLLLGLPAGMGLVLIAGAWRSRRRWPLWVLAGLAVAAAAGLAVLFRTPRFADLFNFQSGTSFVRIKLWLGAWHMALDHPLLGVGPDNFLYAYRTHYVLPSAWQELNLSHPHNILLDTWTRLGLVGVGATGWALIAGWRQGWRLVKADSAIWPLALGLLGGLSATLAHGLIDNSLFLLDLMGIWMMTLGVVRRRTNDDR